MGQKTSTPSRKQPPRAVMSGVATTKSTGGGAASAQQELSEQEDDFMDVPLINVNQVVLKRVDVGEAVDVQEFRVFTREGFIGEIPHALRNKIKEGNYRTGVILSVDKPTVRLFNK